MELLEYRPTLDSLCVLIEEAVAFGRAELVVPDNPAFNGLAADLEKAYFVLMPKNQDHYIGSERSKNCTIFYSSGNRHPLTVVFDRTKKGSIDFPQSLHRHSRIQSKGFIGKASGRISAVSKDAHSAKKTALFSDLMRKQNIKLPEEIPTLLSLKYSSISPYFIEQLYQDFPAGSAANDRNQDSKFSGYPVSDSEDHFITEKAYRLIQAPVYWNARSQLISTVFNLLCGKNDESHLQEKYGEANARIITGDFARLKSDVIDLLNCTVEDRLDCHLDRKNVPVDYAGEYIIKSFKTFTYFLNRDSLNEGSENHQYALRILSELNSYRETICMQPLTIEQLCVCHADRKLASRYLHHNL